MDRGTWWATQSMGSQRVRHNWAANIFTSFFIYICVCLCVCMCVLSCVQLCDSLDHSPPGSSVHRISQARILEWVALPFSWTSSRPRDRTCISCVPALAGGFFTTEQQGSPEKIPLEKEIAIHSVFLAWESPWTEEPWDWGGYSSWGCKESDMTEQWSAHTVIRKRNDLLTSHSNYRQCEKLSSHYFEKVCFLKQKMPINKCRELYIIHLCHKGRSKSLYHRNEMLRMTLTHTAKSDPFPI